MVRESYYDRFATLSPEPKVENLKSKNPGKSQLSTVLTGKEALKIEKELPKTPKTAEIMLEGQVVQNPKAYKQDPMLYRQFQLKPEQLQQLNEDEVYYAMPAESAAEALPYPENIPQEMPEQSKDSPTKTASFAESKSQSMLMYASGPIPGPYSYHQSYIAPYGPTVGPSYTNAPHDSYLGPPMVDPRNSYMPSSHAESPFPPPAPYAPGYQPTGYDYNASYAGYPVYPAMNPYLSPNQEHGFPKVPEASQAYPMAQAPTSELFPLNRPENSMDVAKEYQNANEGGQRKGSQEKLLENIMQDNLSPPKRYMYGCVPINRQFRNWCLIIVAGLITVVIILLVLFFPRMPDQRVTNIEVAKDNSFTMTSVNLTSPSISFDFSMNMIMTVNFTNPNYYSLTVDKIDISAFLIANATQINDASPHPAQSLFNRSGNRVLVTPENQRSQIGSGSSGSITIPPNIVVSIQIPFKLSYSPNKDLGAENDPAMAELIQLCVQDPVLSPTDNRTSVIAYETVNNLGSLSWLGFRPRISNQMNINCPFQGLARANFIMAIQGRGNNATKSLGNGPSKSVGGNGFGGIGILAKQ